MQSVCVCVCVLNWNAALGWQWHTVCSLVATTVRTHTELNIARFNWLIAVITGPSLKKEKGEQDKKHLCHSSVCVRECVSMWMCKFVCAYMSVCSCEPLVLFTAVNYRRRHSCTIGSHDSVVHQGYPHTPAQCDGVNAHHRP